MDIAERIEIPAPVDAVWPILRDIDQVAECFPGAQLTGREPADVFIGSISIKFGPTTAIFNGTATIVVSDDDHSAVITARGTDKRGSSRANARASVKATATEGGTSVVLEGTIEVTGPLGAFANSGGAHVTSLLLQDFARNVSSSATALATPTPQGQARSEQAVKPISAWALFCRVVVRWWQQVTGRRRTRNANR